MGLSIAITPHLDDGLELGGWRNALAFDPLAKYSGYTYWDIMLQPLAQALNAVITPDTQVGLLSCPGDSGLLVVPRLSALRHSTTLQQPSINQWYLQVQTPEAADTRLCCCFVNDPHPSHSPASTLRHP
jgi:hypothetical protein